ncbi:uncharacterized protein LOC116618429 isoform X2 [Nematostella vectensis]|uniref:uncharacterized protein LOC116618429 isoform X2 n=1 Tax=Nematostella vectensis TaxID=45351 RepID=UPI002076DA57|nr:uncharacterized protein LOC116618429 isoform X2 [Nematostella vectensis]
MPRSFVIIKFYSHTRKIDFSFEGIVPPKVSWLREQFFETFKDVIPEGITRKYILFQRYDKSIKEWLDLSDEEYVHPEDIIKADIEQVPEVPHPIKDAKIYRLWSSSSRTGGSLLKMEKSSNILKCDGLNSQDCSAIYGPDCPRQSEVRAVLLLWTHTVKVSQCGRTGRPVPLLRRSRQSHAYTRRPTCLPCGPNSFYY